jgi:hypothetical protein
VPWIIEYLNKQDYDIVALEEVTDRKITEDLKRGLIERYPYIVAPRPPAHVDVKSLSSSRCACPFAGIVTSGGLS